MGLREIAGVVGEAAPRRKNVCALPQAATLGRADKSFATSIWVGAGVVLRCRGGIAVEAIPGLAVAADARIDNAPDLRHELGLGPVVPTEKLIAAAYAKWQDDCPAHLEGDFAFAIWDARERRLLCARDPAGIRPLYYTHSGGIFRFAQSPGVLLRAHQHNLPLRDEAVADFLYGRVMEAEGTFFAGVKRLQAGHALVLRSDTLSLRRYFDLAPSAPAGRDGAEEFRHLLDEAVRKRSGGHERVGALLSGGLDSSSGVSELCGVKGYLTLDLSPGFGYSGIVVAMLAALHPLGVVLAAVFIAVIYIGADSMRRAMTISNYIADVTTAVCLLTVLVAMFLTRYRIRWK